MCLERNHRRNRTAVWLRQFAKPPLYTIRVDFRKILTVHTRCALVGAALGIGMGQNVLATDLVVQGVKPIAGFCLTTPWGLPCAAFSASSRLFDLNARDQDG